MSNIYEINETLNELRTEMSDEKLSYYFAKDVKGADIKAHKQVIIDSAIDGTDTIEYEQVLSESNCYTKVKQLIIC